MHISKNVRYLRRKTGLTQTDLADKIGKTPGTIGDYEKGRSLPPVDIIIEICKIFQVNIDDFVNKDLEKEGAQLTPVQEVQEQYNTKDEKLLLEFMKEKLIEVSKVVKEENPEKYKKMNLDKLSDLIGE